MAVRTSLPARTINGELTSPGVDMAALVGDATYTLTITLTRQPDIEDVAKSLSAYIEYSADGGVSWLCGGGADWRGGPRVNKLGQTYFVSSFAVPYDIRGPNGEVIDRMKGTLVRARLNAPAVQWDRTEATPGTVGDVRCSGQLTDSRAT